MLATDCCRVRGWRQDTRNDRADCGDGRRHGACMPLSHTCLLRRCRGSCATASLTGCLDSSRIEQDNVLQTTEFIFPSERYRAAGDDFNRCVYRVDATKPIGTFKEAWEKLKKELGGTCRFHDLRHTACTRLLEAGIAFSVVASIMGWSAATTARMVKRYGHIGQDARRNAMDAIGTEECSSAHA